MNKFLPILIFVGFLSVAFPGPTPASPQAPIVGTTFAELLILIDRLANWIFSILVIVAVVMLVWGAFGFVISEGEPDRLKKAKDRITYAIIGLVLAIFTKSIIAVIKSIIGVKF